MMYASLKAANAVSSATVRIETVFGVMLVIVLHLALLYMVMHYHRLPAQQESVTLLVNLINPVPPRPEIRQPEPLKPPPTKVRLQKTPPVERPQSLPLLVAETPVVTPADMVAAPPPVTVATSPVSEPAVISEPVSEPVSKPVAPAMLGSELSLACPNRTPPNYPAASRRMGEHGRVVLRVELDETGRITTARVRESSGYKRLDEAGLLAVKSWECNAAIKDGEPVKAVALQPFDFVLD